MSAQGNSPAAVGRYRLVRTIASGGMAQVLEGIAVGDGGFRRRVAIKRILPEFAEDPSFRRMFLDEARIASHLHHANIVQVLDYGIADGSEFIVLEYVDGIDAQRASDRCRAAGRPIPEAVALHIAAEVAHALDHAASRIDREGRPLGIVHRDISPSNILLSWDGGVKLSDFGIALAQSREERTRTGVVKGKANFMAPEQALGQPLTGAADVFALGATLYSLLSGTTAPITVFPERSGLALDIKELTAACLALSPGDRPAALKVATLAEELVARRLSAGPRGPLREWLAPLKSDQKRAGGFDAMVNLCLVPIEGGTERGYTVVRNDSLEEGRERPAGLPFATTATAQGPLGRRTARPKHRLVRRFVLLVVALAALTITGAVTLIGPSPPAMPREAARVERPEPPASQPPISPARAEPEVAAAPPSSSIPLEKTPQSQRTARKASRAQVVIVDRTPTEQPTPAPPPALPEVAPPRGDGWLRVGGSSMARAPVEVDGRRAGHAPVELRLAIGGHRVVVRDPESGQILVDQNIVLDEQHRRASPFRIVR